MSREQHFIDSIGRTGHGEADLRPVLAALRTWLAALGQASTMRRSGRWPAIGSAWRAHRCPARPDHQARRREAAMDCPCPCARAGQRFEGKLMLLVFGKFNAKARYATFSRSVSASASRRCSISTCKAVSWWRVKRLSMRALPKPRRACRASAWAMGWCCWTPRPAFGHRRKCRPDAAFPGQCRCGAVADQFDFAGTGAGARRTGARTLPGKPLLPVLTRSDVIDEDEVDGQIVKCLRNKSDANRADQEADVRARAADKLQALGVALHQLKAPVSISAYVARTAGADAEAMRGAGFERLYAALSTLLAPALAYRDRKPAEVLLHHLQEDVLAPLLGQTLPALKGLQQLLEGEQAALPAQRARIVQLAWREVMPGVPALLEQHAASGEVDAVLARLQPQLLHAFDRHARAVLDSHVLAAPAPVALVLPAGSGYERVADDLPPSYEKLYEALSQSVLAALEQLADEVAGHCTARLAGLSDAVSVQQDIIEEHAQQLASIEEQLRPVPEDMAQR
jgi:hypothetical protein